MPLLSWKSNKNQARKRNAARFNYTQFLPMMASNHKFKTYMWLHIKGVCAALIIWVSPTQAAALDFTLVCNGQESYVSIAGVSKDPATETYEFVKGKLYGIFPATWTETEIKVVFPTNLPRGDSILESRTVVLDRISGQVRDIGVFTSKSLGVKARREFVGTCELGKKKF
jgi:hypothetical protein